MSTTTKLPTPSGSVGTWGAELNDFLTQSMVGTTTGDVTNGLLKIDHAAITTGGKVGIGTSTPLEKLSIAGNVSINPGNALLFKDVASLNYSSFGSSSQSGMRLESFSPQGFALSVGGDINPLQASILISPDNVIQFKNSFVMGYGTNKDTFLRPDTNTSILVLNDTSVGKTEISGNPNSNVMIGSGNPTSKLHVIGLPTFADNAVAIAGGLTAGAFYRTSTGALFVTI